MAELKTLLFDLDGTLVSTREASWELFRRTNEKFGLGVDTPSAFFHLFDQNFYAALDEASGGNGSADDVRRHFQALLRTEYSPDFIPGMVQVVRGLASHYTLIVLSSNTMEAVRRILLANGVAHCFAHVFSSDVTQSKQEAITRFLDDPSYSCGRRCSPHYEEGTPPRRHHAAEAMLITDTVGDVTEAIAAGIRVGAVSWGMHRATDLERAGAEFVCIWPEELTAYLQPGEVCASGACHLPSAALETTPVAPATATVAPPPARQAEPPAARGSQAAPSTPGPIRRARRTAAAHRLAEQIDSPAAAAERAVVPETCFCNGSGTGHTRCGDPTLRRAIELLARQKPGRVVVPGQSEQERLSPPSLEAVADLRKQSDAGRHRIKGWTSSANGM